MEASRLTSSDELVNIFIRSATLARKLAFYASFLPLPFLILRFLLLTPSSASPLYFAACDSCGIGAEMS